MPYHSNTSRRGEAGLTLIEILVVIAIIGVLSTMAAVSVNVARGKARVTRAQAEISEIRKAMTVLANDTYKWPNGCPIEEVANPEVGMDDPQSGLAVQPSVGDQGDGCEWVAEDLARWNGPYFIGTLDPWGNPYYFDPDYRPYDNCASIPDEGELAAVLSFGPNGDGVNAYDCDDIWIPLK